ncbi:MAG: hypothetical protein ACI86M_000691 [Saprospiraceae bacterium]|jgi:hypothetical protein
MHNWSYQDIKELLTNVNIVPTLISHENYFDTFIACIGDIKIRVKSKEKLDQFEHGLLDTQVLKNGFVHVLQEAKL